MEINPGVTGAKRQTWDKRNPRNVLRDAIMANPGASEAETAQSVWSVVRDDAGYQKAIFDYWFANNYRHFFLEEMDQHATAFRKTQAPDPAISAKTVEIAKDEIKKLLLDHTLANGKKLRFATFGECAKEGGWLSTVAKQGKGNEIVGKKLTETDLINLRIRAFR